MSYTVEERRRSHNDLPSRLRAVAATEAGSCVCHAAEMLDDWKFHHVDCRWRLLMQAASRIEELEKRP